MRLFIAIEPDDNIKSYLESLQKAIISPDAKLTISKGCHLTLKFMGDVPEEKLELLKAGLEKVKFDKFVLNTSAVGFFPGERTPKVVWVGVEPKNNIVTLQEDIDREAEKLGFPKENRFHPHITLARVKDIKDRGWTDKLKSIKTEKLQFEVDSFVLFRSELRPEGPEYTILKEFKSRV